MEQTIIAHASIQNYIVVIYLEDGKEVYKIASIYGSPIDAAISYAINYGVEIPEVIAKLWIGLDQPDFSPEVPITNFISQYLNGSNQTTVIDELAKKYIILPR